MVLQQYLASVHNEGPVLNDGLIGGLAADEHEVRGRVERLHSHTGSSLVMMAWWDY